MYRNEEDYDDYIYEYEDEETIKRHRRRKYARMEEDDYEVEHANRDKHRMDMSQVRRSYGSMDEWM